MTNHTKKQDKSAKKVDLDGKMLYKRRVAAPDIIFGSFAENNIHFLHCFFLLYMI